MADFNLNTALRAVSARRTEAQVREQEQLTSSGRGRLDPSSPAMRIARAQQYEKEKLEELKFLRHQPKTELIEMRIHAVLDRIGELAAEQGDYSRAATISISPERREHYSAMVKAIRRPDDHECQCPPDLVVDRKKGEEIRSPAMMTVDTIVSPNGGALNVDQCRKCGFMNAR
jgi:hypothetical protein